MPILVPIFFLLSLMQAKCTSSSKADCGAKYLFPKAAEQLGYTFLISGFLFITMMFAEAYRGVKGSRSASP